MNCQTFRQHLGTWLDGSADGRTRASLRAHATICPDCAIMHRTRQSLRAITQASNADEQVPNFLRKVLEDTVKMKAPR